VVSGGDWLPTWLLFPCSWHNGAKCCWRVRRGVKTGCDGFAVGDVVMLQTGDGTQAADDDVAAEGTLGLLQALWQTTAGATLAAEIIC